MFLNDVAKGADVGMPALNQLLTTPEAHLSRLSSWDLGVEWWVLA